MLTNPRDAFRGPESAYTSHIYVLSVVKDAWLSITSNTYGSKAIVIASVSRGPALENRPPSLDKDRKMREYFLRSYVSK